jgi:hypothetical protein
MTNHNDLISSMTPMQKALWIAMKQNGFVAAGLNVVDGVEYRVAAATIRALIRNGELVEQSDYWSGYYRSGLAGKLPTPVIEVLSVEAEESDDVEPDYKCNYTGCEGEIECKHCGAQMDSDES